MPADNSAYLAAATQRRASAARARARTAIRRLDREGRPNTHVPVPPAGNVSPPPPHRAPQPPPPN